MTNARESSALVGHPLPLHRCRARRAGPSGPTARFRAVGGVAAARRMRAAADGLAWRRAAPRAFVTFVAAALVALAAPVRAGRDVRVVASVSPSAVAAGESAELVVRVEGAMRGVDAPELPAIDGLAFHAAGTSQNMQWVNGRMSASIEYSFLVVADRPGTYRIEPIRVRVGDRDYTAAPVTLEVTAARRAVPAPATGGGRARSGRRGGAAGAGRGAAPVVPATAGGSIFVRARVDRDTVYVGQQVTWTMGYYTDGRVALLRSPNYTPPEATGFWVEDLPQRRYETTIDGRRYSVSEVRRAYFPTAPGHAVIGPASVDVVVDAFTTRGLLDELFSRGFSAGLGGKQYRLLSDTLRVVVLPLPSRGRPAGFTGAVASDVTIQASVDRAQGRVGEPVTLTVTLDGTGNMQGVALPALPDLDGFRVYESQSKSSTFRSGDLVRGRKTVQYVMVPRRAGRFTVPPIELAYFDPEARRYRVARSHPVALSIEPGQAESQRRVVYAGRRGGFEVLDRDIRYIHPSPPPMRARSRRAGAVPRALVHVLPLLAVALAALSERRRLRREDDSPAARAARALSRAMEALDRARRAVGEGERDRAASLAAGAVRAYFADRLGESRAGITRERILDVLGEGETARVLARSLDALEAAAYAGAAGSVDAATIDRVREVLRTIDREVWR